MLEDLLQHKPYNAATDFVDAPVTRGLGKKIAFIDADRSLTYGELQTHSCQFADALKNIGLRMEERLALLLYDTVDFPIAFWGCFRAGVVALPLNTQLTPEQYVYILNDSRTSAIVAVASLAKILLPILDQLPFLKTLILVNANSHEQAEFTKHEVYNFSEFLAHGKNTLITAPTFSDNIAFWMYTSGSTGEPKAVKHVHTTLMATARLMGQNVLEICENDVVFSAAKLFFSYGMGNAMAFPMSVGATTVLLPEKTTPDAIFDIMHRYHPTIFFGVPTLYALLLMHKKMCHGLGSSHLRLAVSAGDTLPENLGKQWRETSGIDVLDGIGSTEMFQTFLSNQPYDVRYGTTGKAVPGYNLKIINEQRHEVIEGEVGELIVQGPTAGNGYWNQHLKTHDTFVGEWTYTGDKFFRDTEGYYHYCGRTDDMFKVNGMWLSPFEVEAVLTSHEAVLEAAVVGKEDTHGLLKPKAFIVLHNGYKLDEELIEALKIHVKKHIEPWKYPRWIDACSSFPKTATGKLQRFKLKLM